MRFSVVIPTIDRVDNLRRTLASIAAADPPPAEVVVVDASAERSAEEVAEEFGVHYVHTAPGLTAQRNRGTERATGEVIVFLDDDVEIAAEFFSRLVAVYEDADVVGATGRILELDSGRLGGPQSRVRKLLPGGGREGTFTRYGYPRYLRNPDRPADVEFMQGSLMSAR